MNDEKQLLRRARIWLALFMVGLVLAGVSALPLTAEVSLLERIAGEGSAVQTRWPQLAAWVSRIHQGVAATNSRYPFIFYGTDWLAFGHFVIALAFLGPLRDPVRNRWVIEFGLLACLLVLPMALLCGPLRGIPFFWRLIDCSFGVAGLIPLYLAYRYTCRLAELEQPQRTGA